MANKKSSIKRIKVSEKAAIRNLKHSRDVKGSVKKVTRKLTEQNIDKKEIGNLVKKAYQAIDKATKGSMHKNKASRIKSRLMKKVNKAVK